MTISPWLIKNFEQLIPYKKNNCLPPAILLTGPTGIGKANFAKEYAQFILCQQDREAVCSTCRSCVLFRAGNHPDFFHIHGEEKNSVIKIDQVRNLIETLEQTPVLNGYQVAIISLAEDMNKAAANALLKTLEEPRGKVVMLLLSDQPSKVTSTIRSRCQQIKLTLPTKEAASQWLKKQVESEEMAENYLSIADNLPMKALEYAQSNFKEIRDTILNHLQQIKKGALEPILAAADNLTLPNERLQCLFTFILDMIRIKYSSQVFLNHRDKIAQLTALSQNISLENLFKFLDEILEAIRLVANKNNVNLQLLMEKVFICWRYNHDVS